MKYLQLICIERETTDEENGVMRDRVGEWVDATVASGQNIVGKPLDGPETAKTVRVRDGETLISDGPFADTKEFIGGLDILECDSLDDAIEVASKHPVSWFNAIELRPFADYSELPGCPPSETVPPDPYPSMQYILMMCLDGIPEAPEIEEGIMREAGAWREAVEASGHYVYGHALRHADTATTVRVRNGETLLTDGPFVETKEFLGGFALLSCDSEQEAVDLAAKHPLARFHRVEVRRFIDL